MTRPVTRPTDVFLVGPRGAEGSEKSKGGEGGGEGRGQTRIAVAAGVQEELSLALGCRRRVVGRGVRVSRTNNLRVLGAPSGRFFFGAQTTGADSYVRIWFLLGVRG